MYEKEIGLNRTDISGNSNLLKEFTADVNLALDDYFRLAITATGKWQLDDSNHTDYPVIYANIVSGTQDYSFTADSSSNLIQDIYKVAILQTATATLYQEIYPIDAQSDDDAEYLVSDDTTGGIPDRYDKTANAIFLSPTPNYSVTNGIKIYINREPSYFVSTDTTKKPGFTIEQSYFYMKPALEYARRKSLSNERKIKERVLEMERNIVDYYSKRSRDERDFMTNEGIIYE